METILTRIEIRQPASELSPIPMKRRTPWKRIALAAACVVLMSLALLPVSASNQPAAPVRVDWQVNAPRMQAAVAVPARVAVVRRGDTLWAIAARTLGNPERWREIWSLNLGSALGAGERFADPNLIKTGWRLRLPSR